jgi:hypothetical protein
MKKDLKYLQHFNQKFAQWETKTRLHKAYVDNNLIFFRSRGGAVPSNPHNRHVMKVSSLHGVNLTLFNGRLSEDGMAWPPGPVFRIFIAIVRIFRQIHHYFLCDLLCICFCHRFLKPSKKRVHNFLLLRHLLLFRHATSTCVYHEARKSSESL